MCSSWLWYYPYRHAPLLEDLVNYLTTEKSLHNIADIAPVIADEPMDPKGILKRIIPAELWYMIGYTTDPPKRDRVILDRSSQAHLLYKVPVFIL